MAEAVAAAALDEMAAGGGEGGTDGNDDSLPAAGKRKRSTKLETVSRQLRDGGAKILEVRGTIEVTESGGLLSAAATKKHARLKATLEKLEERQLQLHKEHEEATAQAAAKEEVNKRKDEKRLLEEDMTKHFSEAGVCTLVEVRTAMEPEFAGSKEKHDKLWEKLWETFHWPPGCSCDCRTAAVTGAECLCRGRPPPYLPHQAW